MISKKILFPLSTGLLFSGAYISAKYTTVDLGPLTTSFLRYLVALVFLSFFLIHYKIGILNVARGDIGSFFLLGLSGILGYHYFFLLSLRYTVVANTAIINAASPILTAIAAAIFIKERLTWSNYSGVVLAFIGVIVLLVRGSMANLLGMNVNIGDALMLLATLSWVVYALVVKRLIDKYSGFTITFYATLFGVALLFLLALSENFTYQIQHISDSSIYAVLYMGVCSSGLGYLLYNLSIREIGPTRTSSFVYSLVPILVAILALLFFGQPITWVMVCSMVLIIAGLNFVLVDKKKN
jgi:drug/metabolite transporter (DMT)-like permease